MEFILKKALDQICADEGLKKRTAEYVLSTGLSITPIKSLHASKKNPFNVKRLVAAACVAVVLCALPIGAYAYYKTPTSYVSVDINPSVELGINAFGKVVSVKAYNLDGETVISGLTLLDSDVETAVNLIVTSASQNGFINDDGSSFISVTTETNNEPVAEELEEDAQAGAEDAIESEDDSATIITDNVALERRDEAIALGITPGKLNLIQKLQALDPTILTDDYKDASVKEIQNKFHELKKELKINDELDGDETVSPDPSSSPDPSASPSASPDASPSSSPDGSSKPGNGNHNGNGNKKDDNSTLPPSPDNTNTQSDSNTTPSPSAGSDPSNPPNGNSNNGNSSNANHGKDNGNNGKDNK